MTAVLISINPEMCERIANGKKPVEVRKTRPRLEAPPFKCYIYCTTGKTLYRSSATGFIFCTKHSIEALAHNTILNQKIIGEFICDRITEFKVFEDGAVQNWNYADLDHSCLSYEEISDYIGKGNTGYGWHISDLKIYDEPKILYHFCKPCEPVPGADCEYCRSHGRSPSLAILNPPQSWRYVEEMSGT